MQRKLVVNNEQVGRSHDVWLEIIQRAALAHTSFVLAGVIASGRRGMRLQHDVQYEEINISD